MLLRSLPMLAALLTFVAAGPALAHEGAAAGGGLVTGFLHPIFGWDHVAAMVAVGLWGAFLGQPAIWVLPVAFPLVMAGGGALALAGVGVPAVEIGIAASALVIGLMVALAARPPLAVAAAVVALFAVFHGHAHGTEMPLAANPIAYAVGFVIATGLLHLAGIALGVATRAPMGATAVRAGGVVIAVAGAYFLYGSLA
jgi:urease accessory protein